MKVRSAGVYTINQSEYCINILFVQQLEMSIILTYDGTLKYISACVCVCVCVCVCAHVCVSVFNLHDLKTPP